MSKFKKLKYVSGTEEELIVDGNNPGFYDEKNNLILWGWDDGSLQGSEDDVKKYTNLFSFSSDLYDYVEEQAAGGCRFASELISNIKGKTDDQ